MTTPANWRPVPSHPGLEASDAGELRANWAEVVARGTFPHLAPAAPTRDRLHHCDLCGDGEHADILAARGIEASFAADLRPMYVDARDGITVCRRCAEAGGYLVIETCGETTPP